MTKNGAVFFGTLGLMLIIFKLMGVIDWSWWIVLLPIYWVFALGAIVIELIVVAYVVLGFIDIANKKQRKN